MRWSIGLLFGFLAYGQVLADEPCLYVWEWPQLTKVKQEVNNPNFTLADDLIRLRREAEKALKNSSYSVTSNEFVPPSGDKHDYVSFGAYWWPDPDKADGLPYIRRDGETNEAQKSLGDKNCLNSFAKDVETLSLAYFLFNEERYAQHAVHLINQWFLNPTTRMNPHLEFAQGVVGRNHGKSSGIIDSRDFIYVLESLELLKGSASYSNDLETELRQWFAEFFEWLRTSQFGQKEHNAANNHGSWYHAQALRIALFLDDRAAANELFLNVRNNLISGQILPDGTQPEELARTNSLHYSIFNLAALATVARIGEALGEDLWQYSDSEGKGLRAAGNYLRPFMNGEAKWPHQQITEYRASPYVYQLFRTLSTRYEEPRWLEVGEIYSGSSPAYGHVRLLTSAYPEEF
jgi:hypothetical protein